MVGSKFNYFQFDYVITGYKALKTYGVMHSTPDEGSYLHLDNVYGT